MSVYAKILFANQVLSGDQITGDVYIALYDILTDAPVNGDNREVLYDLTDSSGLPFSGAATIVGMQTKIFTGLIAEDSPAYTIRVDITSIGEPDSGSGSGQCDLLILSVEILQPETDGSSDGSVKIHATSTYGPIAFSIDLPLDITYDHTFTGLTAGTYTAYAKDANDCIAELEFTLPLISDILVSGPEVDYLSKVSRWNAAFNPIVFTFQRKDFRINSTAEYGGKILINANCPASSLSVGDLIYIASGDYDLVAPVLEIVPYMGTNLIALDSPYIDDTVGGFLNIDVLRPSYHVKVLVEYVDQEDATVQTPLVFTNDKKGIIKADVAGLLKNIVFPIDGSDFSLLNYRDRALASSYTIKYSENWTGYAGEYVSISTPYYATYAARQLGDKYGGNLYEYVPKIGHVAKFLNMTHEPMYSPGYPFDIGFIYSEHILGQDVKVLTEFLDVNRQVISSSDGLLLNEDGSFLLNLDGSRFIITGNATNPSGEIMPEKLGVNRLRVYATPPATAYYVRISLTIADVAITEAKVLRIDKGCDNALDAIYLRWMGLLGSWEYHRFDCNHSRTVDVSGATVKKYIEDWANEVSLNKANEKSASEKITVETTDIPRATALGLSKLNYSIEVQVLVSISPVKWQTVIVNNGSFNVYESGDNTATISTSFYLPSANIQTQ